MDLRECLDTFEQRLHHFIAEYAKERVFVHAGVVGYVYFQLSGDSGDGAVLGDFESSVVGVGPQAGWSFDVGGSEWYVELRGYVDLAAEHRPQGWDAWLTLAIPL